MPIGTIGTAAIGSGIQFGLNTASGLINQAFAKRNAKIQAQYNKELMDYQFNLQQQAINQQNEYNSPAAQMERLKEAGLNPNLAYGGVSQGNQTSTPKVNSPAPANYQNQQTAFNNIMQYVDVIGKMAQVQQTLNQSTKGDILDVQLLRDKWYMDNMLPNYLTQLKLKNIGLGYDNTISKNRADISYELFKNQLAYQKQMTDNAAVDFSIKSMMPGILKSQNDYTKQQILHSKQATANMYLQNELLTINKIFEQWSKALLKENGIIPGVTSSKSTSLSLGINAMGVGGNASRSASSTGPIRFNYY